MKIPFNDLSRHHENFKDQFHDILTNAIKNSSFVRGQQITDFENSFSNLVNKNFCIGVANGTDALEIALKSLNLSFGDEVIVPSHTWISTAEAVSNVGLKLKFCDTDLETFNICTKSLEESITSKTKALIVVHFAGQAANMDEILRITKKFNLFLIEDCAQAHLSKFKEKYVGNFGDIATYSFYPGKNLGALGDAGCLTTNSEKLSERIRLIANHGCYKKGIHLMEGRNSRLDTIQASFLSAKLPYLKEFTFKRQEIANTYNANIDNKYLTKPKVLDFTKPVWHLYILKTKHRDLLKSYLSEKGISSVINYIRSLPENEAFEYLKTPIKKYKNSQANAKEVLSIPLFPEMKKEEIDYVIFSLNKFKP